MAKAMRGSGLQRGMAPVVSAQAGVIVGEVGERASRAGAACSGWGWRLCGSLRGAAVYDSMSRQRSVYRLLVCGRRGAQAVSAARAELGCDVEVPLMRVARDQGLKLVLVVGIG